MFIGRKRVKELIDEALEHERKIWTLYIQRTVEEELQRRDRMVDQRIKEAFEFMESYNRKSPWVYEPLQEFEFNTISHSKEVSALMLAHHKIGKLERRLYKLLAVAEMEYDCYGGSTVFRNAIRRERELRGLED